MNQNQKCPKDSKPIQSVGLICLNYKEEVVLCTDTETECPGSGTAPASCTLPSSQNTRPWTRLINRIPRATRTSCMLLLTQLIEAITKAPNNKSDWENLFNCGPAILTKPARGGGNRNLSNIINKRVTKMILFQIPISSKRNNRGNNENNLLASIIVNKLEMGNFKAAVRILCSSTHDRRHI